MDLTDQFEPGTCKVSILHYRMGDLSVNNLAIKGKANV